jgi:ATP-dependent protease HslVU (ClpYQ) peptidase subunit
MTVIAYRDGVLASDSILSNGGMQFASMRKIGRRFYDGSLYAGTGNAADVAAFMRWCEDGRPGDAKPKLTNMIGVVVTATGEILEFDENLNWFTAQGPIYATGSGAAFAIGAMAMGADATTAVSVAIHYESSCGGEIQVERLIGSAS